MNIQRIGFVEFYVSHVERARKIFFEPLGFAPPPLSCEGALSSSSQAFRRAQMAVVLTPAAASATADAYVERHGDGIGDIAFVVDDVDRAFEDAFAHGAEVLEPPRTLRIGPVETRRARLGGFGSITHSLVGANFDELLGGADGPELAPTLVRDFDHVAICVPHGLLDEVSSFYERIFGFELIHKEAVETPYSGMNSRVMSSRNRKVHFPILSPVSGSARGQIQDFLAHHGAAGVQHLALLTSDIARSVHAMRGRGMGFLSVSPAYYEHLRARPNVRGCDIDALERAGVLLDQGPAGHLLQIFSRSRHPRGTFFFELVERHGSSWFASANIRGLFLSLEQEHRSRQETA
jgi:4-hydroxymandelate synthase